MRWLLFCLLFLLVACIPRAGPDFTEDFFSSDLPIWQVNFEASIQTAIAALQPFVGTQEVRVSTTGADTDRRRIRELEADWLEQNRLMILLVFQGDKLVLAVIDLANAKRSILESTSLGARVNAALIEALDQRFKRSAL